LIVRYALVAVSLCACGDAWIDPQLGAGARNGRSDASGYPPDALVLGHAPNPCLDPSDGPTVIANARAGLTNVQGQCGWYYGYLPTASSTDLRLFSVFDDASRIWWLSKDSYLRITSTIMSPNGGAAPVRRWESDVAGSVRVVGSASLPDPGQAIVGNGVVIRIRVDGLEVRAIDLPKAASMPASFDIAITVKVGSTIDVVCDPRDGNSFYDTTLVDLRDTPGAGRADHTLELQVAAAK
jgi:hypothetical protein